MIWSCHILSISQGNRRLRDTLDKRTYPNNGTWQRAQYRYTYRWQWGSARLNFLLQQLLIPLYTVIITTLNLRRADKPWKIATPASETNLRSSTLSNLPGTKSSREHGTRYPLVSTAAFKLFNSGPLAKLFVF